MQASAASPGQEWAFVTLVLPAVALTAVLVVRFLVRAAEREGERARAAVAACPWNDAPEVVVGHARIGAVVSLDDELLVELRWQPSRPDDHERVSWLVAPVNRGALTALERWNESNVVVSVSSAPGGFLLRTTRTSLSVRAAHRASPTNQE